MFISSSTSVSKNLSSLVSVPLFTVHSVPYGKGLSCNMVIYMLLLLYLGVTLKLDTVIYKA